MRDTAHKLYYEYLLVLLVMFACLISSSRTYADNHVKVTRTVIPKSASDAINIPRSVVTSKPLTVSISPPSDNVVQGSPAAFKAIYNKKNVRLKWKWQMNEQSGNSTNFTVNTKSLKPGTYFVNLVATESLQINSQDDVQLPPRQKFAKAKLFVRAAELAPLRVKIIPSKLVIEQGETITFKSSSNTRSLKYNWIGADQTGDRKDFVITSNKLSPGTYSITLKVWDKDGRPAEDSVEIQVKKKKRILIPVPDVTQQYLVNAIALLESKNFKLGETKFVERKRNKTNWVFEQKPVAGTGALPNSKIDLFVYRHPPPLEVSINPPNPIIEKGKELPLVAESKDELTSYEWQVAGQRGISKRFIIQTQDLSVKSYEIELKVGDKQGRDKTVLATLQVIKPEAIPIIVPNVINLTLDDAIRRIQEKQLNTGNINYREILEGDGKVVEQTPKAGVEVKPGRKVDLWISKEKVQPVLIFVPDLIDQDIKSAQELLTESGLVSGSITEKVVSSGEPGRVLEQIPKAGVEVKPDSKVDLWISKKKAQPVFIPVPDLIGKDIKSAQEILMATGLIGGSITDQVVSSGEARRVLEQSPIAMTQVKKGSVVNLIISSVPIDKSKITLELNVENSRHFVGKATIFQLNPSGLSAADHYWLQLDEGQSSDKFNQTRYEHVFKQIGLHRVYAKMRVNDEVYKSDPVNIWILPTWLIPIAAGLGLLSLGAGIVKSASPSPSPSPPKVVKKFKGPRITVKPITDYGYQEISRLSLVENKDNNIDGQEYRINIGFDNSLNEGEWEVLIEETHNKIKGSYSDE